MVVMAKGILIIRRMRRSKKENALEQRAFLWAARSLTIGFEPFSGFNRKVGQNTICAGTFKGE